MVYDHLRQLYTPDCLIGLHRAWAMQYKPPRRSKWLRRNGCKKSVFGGFRKIKTFQERKWAHAWDDEEFAPKARTKRQGHYLPDPWDDFYAHGAKSWKHQSKRKHQWKEK